VLNGTQGASTSAGPLPNAVTASETPSSLCAYLMGGVRVMDLYPSLGAWVTRRSGASANLRRVMDSRGVQAAAACTPR
jgi:hypothetical protein